MHRILTLVLLALALLPAAAFAQQVAPAAALPAWEQLSDAQREQLIAPIRDRWNSAPASDRSRMLERAKRWQAMPPEARQRARHGFKRFEGMKPEQREQARALFHAMRGMDAAQRKGFLEKWKAMSAEQRRAWVDSHPAPRHPPHPDGPHKPVD